MIKERLANELGPIVINRHSFKGWEEVFYSAYKNLGMYREIREYVKSEERVASFFIRAYEEDDGLYTEFLEFSSPVDRNFYQQMFNGIRSKNVEQHGFVIFPAGVDIQSGTQLGQM